jgi:hypothetical protein
MTPLFSDGTFGARRAKRITSLNGSIFPVSDGAELR